MNKRGLDSDEFTTGKIVERELREDEIISAQRTKP